MSLSRFQLGNVVSSVVGLAQAAGVAASFISAVCLVATLAGGGSAWAAPAMQFGGDVRQMSVEVCARKAVEAMGIREKFILAEMHDGYVIGQNEKTTVLVTWTPVNNGLYIAVVAAGQDNAEAERLRNSIRQHVFNGLYKPNTPKRISNAGSGRVIGGSAMHFGWSSAKFDVNNFHATAPAIARQQGLSVSESGNTLLFGTKRDAVIAVKYVEQTRTGSPGNFATGTGSILFVAASPSSSMAEKLRNDVRSALLSPPGPVIH